MGVKRNGALCLGNYRAGIGSSPRSTYPLGIVISSIATTVTTNTGSAPLTPRRFFALSPTTLAMPVYTSSRSLLSADSTIEQTEYTETFRKRATPCLLNPM